MREFLKNFDYLKRLKFIGGFLIALTVLTYLANIHRYFEMINSFAVYYFYLLLLLAIPFFIKKQWIWGTAFLLFSFLNLSKFAYLYFSPDQASVSNTEKLLILNLFTANKEHQKVIKLIKEEQADHICLVEVNDRWEFEIRKSLNKEYPHVIAKPRSDNFGILFMSKKPFKGEIIYVDGIPVIKAIYPEKTIVSVHPLPPISKNYFQKRNEFLAEIKNWNLSDKNLIVCGDFNAVPWSPFFKKMLKENNLKLASQGFGINTSWPTNIPFLRIPIDHCLVSQNGSIKSYKIGPNVGSDHFPIVAEFGFTQDQETTENTKTTE